MKILGIDPGIVGALAIYGEDSHDVADLPVMGEGAGARINAAALARLIKGWKPDHAFIERAQAMPKQGSSSGFKYGRAVGAIEAAVALCLVPLTIIEPRAWKHYYSLRGGDKKEIKERSRQRAIQLFPSMTSVLARKLDHGRAEALLIARYGFCTVSQAYSQARETQGVVNGPRSSDDEGGARRPRAAHQAARARSEDLR